jgi:hypothetical protein
MKKIPFLFVLLVLSLLAGCDDIKTALHMMPNQDEQECLNSERLKFKDPDVLFVANLGSRGLESTPNHYWVRYKAKNSYGAYVQGNMACKKDSLSGKWVRDEGTEALTKMGVINFLLDRATEQMQRDLDLYKEKKIRLIDFKYNDEKDVMRSVEKDSETIIFESPENLTPFISK